MTVFECSPDSLGNIPPSPIRRKLKTRSGKRRLNISLSTPMRQKTIRNGNGYAAKPDGPLLTRAWFCQVTGREALLQKISHLEIPVNEEGDLSIFGVTTRAQAAFDVDKVTKKFYERFKQEHAVFLNFIKGITSQQTGNGMHRSCLTGSCSAISSSAKAFLMAISNIFVTAWYLQEKKGKTNSSVSTGIFSWAFHEGLGKREHSGELDALIGKVPYLNGGFFDIHKLEQNNPEIDIPDKAFEKSSTFSMTTTGTLMKDLYATTRKSTPTFSVTFLRIYQPETDGRYYTKEDITGYISKNTLFPGCSMRRKRNARLRFSRFFTLAAP